MDNAMFRRYMAALHTNFSPAVRIEFLHDDGTTALEITEDAIDQGSTINVNYQNGARRSASLIMDNWDDTYSYNINKIWFGQKIRIRAGLYLTDGTPALFDQGVFYVSNPQDVFNPAQRTATLQLVDKWAYLDGSLFGKVKGVYLLNVGNDLFVALQQLLLTDRGNGFPIDNIPPMLSNYYIGRMTTVAGQTHRVLDCPYTAKISGCYADVLNEIGTMLVATMGYDASGQLRVESINSDIISDNMRQVLWQFTTDEPELYGITETPHPTSMYNHIVITGGVLNGAIAKGEAINNDPSSPTNVNVLGYKTFSEERSKYYADSQCQELAEYYLNQYKNLSSTVNISCSPMYHFVENQLVTVWRESKDDSAVPCLVTGWTLPIGMGQMQITAKRLNPARDFFMLQPQDAALPLGYFQLGSDIYI